MHRPGIASVVGDEIVLDGTTVEEVERYHAETLRHVIPAVNKEVADIERKERQRAEARRREQEAHAARVTEASKKIKFE
jgi:hypothetical protein